MQKQAESNFFCDICNVILPNKPSLMQHKAGQKHLKLYSELEEQKRVARKCGIFVRGYPPNAGQDILLKYFSRFGKVVWTHFGSGFLLLDYSDPFDALTVLKGNHYIGGRYLTIRYRELKSKQTFSKNFQLEDHDHFNNQLKNVRKLDAQLQLLMAHLEVGNSRQYPLYNKVCRDLHDSLICTYPGVQIFPFGSTITGLGFKNSDIDVYVGGVRHSDNNVPFLYKIKNILLNSNRFTNCIVIARAKIPIMKCVHIESNINCDINIKNMLGVSNSCLINYYMNLDIKIREAMLIIKYWAKSHQITGQNHLFTNYSLTLMLIFFLQHDPHKVPSVSSLQKDKKFDDYEDGWNGGFQQKQYYVCSMQELSLAELLAEFFAFYSNFDYSVNIICPYLGKPVKKSDFKTPEQLPVYYKTYKDYIKVAENLPLKVDTPVCVQDPFEHSRNNTSMVLDSTLNIFVNFCRQGKQICKDGEVNLLYRLFTEEPPNIKSEMLSKSNFVQFAVPMGFNVGYIRKTVNDSTPNRNLVIQRAWFDSVNKFLLIVLKDFLKLEVEETTAEDSKGKAKKSEGQKDVHSYQKRIVSYRCSGKINLWQSRKSTLKSVENEDVTGIVSKETEVTKQLLALYKNINFFENIVEFEITTQQKTDPPQVLINLTKISSYKKIFKSFGTFFCSNFISWFETYEKELNALT